MTTLKIATIMIAREIPLIPLPPHMAAGRRRQRRHLIKTAGLKAAGH